MPPCPRLSPRPRSAELSAARGAEAAAADQPLPPPPSLLPRRGLLQAAGSLGHQRLGRAPFLPLILPHTPPRLFASSAFFFFFKAGGGRRAQPRYTPPFLQIPACTANNLPSPLHPREIATATSSLQAGWESREEAAEGERHTRTHQLDVAKAAGAARKISHAARCVWRIVLHQSLLEGRRELSTPIIFSCLRE